MIVRVDRLDLVDTFVTFFALLGPEEMVLSCCSPPSAWRCSCKGSPPLARCGVTAGR
jgi:hypothetical protein